MSKDIGVWGAMFNAIGALIRITLNVKLTALLVSRDGLSVRVEHEFDSNWKLIPSSE